MSMSQNKVEGALPQISYWADAQPESLPDMPGREIIAREMWGKDKGVQRKFIHLRYSSTLSELTQAVEQMGRECDAELEQLRKTRQDLAFYIELPGKVENFMAEVRAQLLSYRDEQSAMLKHVSDALDALLSGKAQETSPVVQYITDILNKQNNRLAQLEDRIRGAGDFPSGLRQSGGVS
jgi:hypothetical protein